MGSSTSGWLKIVHFGRVRPRPAPGPRGPSASSLSSVRTVYPKAPKSKVRVYRVCLRETVQTWIPLPHSPSAIALPSV